MIKTTQILIDELSNYRNPKTKIARMVKNKELFPIIQGLYETNDKINPFYLSGVIYSPSYISFETALSFYGIIPEITYEIKNATFKKRRKKEYRTCFGVYSYQDIPAGVFPYGIELYTFEGYTYRIASKEKALLDQIYSTSSINNMKEMKEYLFENLRINSILIEELNVEFISNIAKLYHSKNVELFEKMIKGGKFND